MATTKKLALFAALIVLTVGVTLFVTADEVSAQGRPMNERILAGTYYFNFFLIQGTEICEEAGFAVFDGNGTVMIEENHAKRCTAASGSPDTRDEPGGNRPYEVAPDGVLTIFEEDEVTIGGRGRIVDNGRIVLFDGTGFGADDPVIHHGIAVKQ